MWCTIPTTRWRQTSTRPLTFSRPPSGTLPLWWSAPVNCGLLLLLLLLPCCTMTDKKRNVPWKQITTAYTFSTDKIFPYNTESKLQRKNCQVLPNDAFRRGSSWASGKGCSAGGAPNECTHLHMTLHTTQAAAAAAPLSLRRCGGRERCQALFTAQHWEQGWRNSIGITMLLLFPCQHNHTWGKPTHRCRWECRLDYYIGPRDVGMEVELGDCTRCVDKNQPPLYVY